MHQLRNLRHIASAIQQVSVLRWELAVALLPPAVMILSGFYQLYPPIGWVDPELYIENFIHLPEIATLSHLKLTALDYHSTRLPFVLVGYFVYSLFTPLIAQALFVISFYTIGVVALVALARTLVSSCEARLALIWLVALNPVWIACFLEGHVDGPAIAFGLLSFAALTASRPRLLGLPRECWAGVAVALALSTQPLPGGIAGLVLLIVAVIAEPTWRGTLGCVGWAALGGICTLLMLGTIGTFFGLPFVYLLTSEGWIGRFLGGATHDAVITPALWLPSATRVALWPVALLLLAVITKWRSPGVMSRPAALILGIMAWTTLFFIINLYTRGFFTQFRFYSSYIFLSLVPTLAIMLEHYRQRRPAKSRWWMALVAVALGFAAPITASRLTHSTADETLGSAVIWTALAVLGLASAVCLRLEMSRLSFAGVALFLAVAAGANGDTAGIFASSQNPSRRAGFIAIAEVQKAVAESGFADKRVLFWFNREKFSQADQTKRPSTYSFVFAGQSYAFNMLDSISAAFGWDRTALGFSMPNFEEMTYRQLANLDRVPTAIVLLCAHFDDCHQGAQALAARGVLFRRKLVRPIAISGVPPFTVLITEVEPDLRTKFPCAAESKRAGYLFDHILSLQTDENRSALVSFFARTIASPSGCFAEFEALSRLVKFDNALSQFPVTSGCELDLDVAESYFKDVFDADLRSETALSLQRASEGYKDQAGGVCLIAAEKVRKAYFDRIQKDVAAAIQPPP